MTNVNQFPQNANTKPGIQPAKPSQPLPSAIVLPQIQQNGPETLSATGSSGAKTLDAMNKALAEINKQMLVVKPSSNTVVLKVNGLDLPVTIPQDTSDSGAVGGGNGSTKNLEANLNKVLADLAKGDPASAKKVLQDLQSSGKISPEEYAREMNEINKALQGVKPETQPRPEPKPQQPAPLKPSSPVKPGLPPLDSAKTKAIQKQLQTFLATLNSQPALLDAMAAVKDQNGKPIFDLNGNGKATRDELLPFFNAIIGAEKNPVMYDKSATVLIALIGQISEGKLKVPDSVRKLLDLSGDGSLGKLDADKAQKFFDTIKPKQPQPFPPKK